MSVLGPLKRRAQALLFPALFVSVTAYFAWHATQGDRGLVAFAQEQQLLKKVQDEQKAAKAERDTWEIRVSGLRSEHLDPDTLDERARAMLNLAQPNEVIVKYDSQNKLF
jgi:cell division protein FtsB